MVLGNGGKRVDACNSRFSSISAYHSPLGTAKYLWNSLFRFINSMKTFPAITTMSVARTGARPRDTQRLCTGSRDRKGVRARLPVGRLTPSPASHPIGLRTTEQYCRRERNVHRPEAQCRRSRGRLRHLQIYYGASLHSQALLRPCKLADSRYNWQQGLGG